MKIKVLGLIATCTIAATSFAAPVTLEAATLTFIASLDGPSESPPVASPGTGFATVVVDDVAHTMIIDATFSGLVGTTTAAHIHCCTAAPGTGTVGVATTTPSFVGFPLGVTSGVFHSELDMTQAGSWNPAFITAHGGTPAGAEAFFLAGMLAGEAYFNIHTSFSGTGEIRGFLAETPLPAALPLFATGLGALGLLGWRRKRKAAANAA
jgi:hypothetical protein